jgi:molybdopterin-guanine dinucleotide biosynthesis protein MobB
MNDLPDNLPVPVVGFAAYSGTGKTTLLKKLIPLLCARQIRVGLIKQSHHDFDIDVPGKDSYELRKAGASQTLITSPYRRVLIHEYKEAGENDFTTCLNSLDTSALDIILVEGFKHMAFTKIELQREGLHKPLLYPTDSNIIAIATDITAKKHALPVLNLNNAEEICDFICLHIL